MNKTLRRFNLWGIRNVKRLAPLALVFFSIQISAYTQTVTSGKSFINITRPNGGTFEPGDIIEVRATIAITGVPFASPVSQLRYNDTVNTAAFTYIPNTLQILSNEGKPQRTLPSLGAPFTDGSDTDSANIRLNTFIRFNIGNGSGACNELAQGNGTTNAGSVWTGLLPRFFNSTTIRVYSFRIRINNNLFVTYGSTISLPAGNFRYRLNSTNYSSNFSGYNITLSKDLGLCANSSGSNAVVGESGGTFGSGTPQNRVTATSFVPTPYTMVPFGANNPNDNFYGLANRTSSDGTTNPSVPYSSGVGSASRVFTVWDIIGDHTGAVSPTLGNPPTNLGYAVIINASYETNRAFTQDITGLCEETYYEFSAWFRNICRRCGCDSTGKGSTQTGYVAGFGSDSSGVRPNLSFQINGEDFYTSGNIPYTGTWVKKGFVFKTKAGQTAMTVTIRNNAPGGGGNDWAIDDIGVSTCVPNLTYTPSITPNVCLGNALTITTTVQSYFDNYTYYKWQKSVNGVGPWTDLGLPIGPVIPLWNGTAWQYIATYIVPTLFTTLLNTGDKYRLLVGTSLANLGNVGCSSTDAINTVTLNVLDCGPVLETKLISFNGKRKNDTGILEWVTVGENEPVFYDVERSGDGINFTTIATVNNDANYVNQQDHYYFTDPSTLNGNAFYRLKIRTTDKRVNYSRILKLTGTTEDFSFVSVINPFRNELLFDVSNNNRGVAKAQLIDQFGKMLKQKQVELNEGVTQLSFPNTSSLAGGIYILRVEYEGVVIYKRVVKQN